MSPQKRDKISLQDYLLENYFDTEEQVQTALKLGIVYLNQKLAKRPGINISKTKDQVTVVGEGLLFVSRGGYKLKKAIDSFGIKTERRICLDIGASTGGFSDCLLQHQAELVYAIDTGYGQLDWKLRKNSRIKCLERTNVRYLLAEKLYGRETPEKEKATLAVVDVSFISAIKLLPSIQSLLSSTASEILILMKPQFEAGKGQVGRGGVIRNKELHHEILLKFLHSCLRAGLTLKKISYSPLLGAAGNLEFLVFLSWSKDDSSSLDTLVDLSSWSERIIKLAYSNFGI